MCQYLQHTVESMAIHCTILTLNPKVCVTRVCYKFVHQNGDSQHPTMLLLGGLCLRHMQPVTHLFTQPCDNW